MSTEINLSESLQKTIALEQRALADGGTLVDRNSTVNSIPYSVLRLNPSFIFTPSAYAEDTLHSIVPNFASGDLTYTRADTNGTVINKDGYIENACYNLLQRSEEFDSGVWTKTNASIFSNVEQNPFGNLNSDKLVANTNNSNHFITEIISTYISYIYTWSIYAKAGEYSFIGIFDNFAGNNTIVFDLINGVQTGGSTIGVSIEDAGNGWKRISRTFTSTGGNTIHFDVYDNSANAIFVGNNSDGIYIWGAQLVEGTQPKDYLKTTDRLNMPRISWKNGEPFMLNEPTRTNYAFNSNSLSTYGGCALSTINNELNPKGNITDVKTCVYSSGGGVRYNGFITFSIGENWCVGNFIKFNGSAITLQASFSVQVTSDTGTFSFDNTGNASSTGSVGYKVYSNGWVYVYFKCTVDTNNNARLGWVANSGSILIWSKGTQYEQGTYPTSYIPTLGTALTRNVDTPVYPSVAPYTEYTWFIDLDNIATGNGTSSGQRIGVGKTTDGASQPAPEIAIWKISNNFIGFADHSNSDLLIYQTYTTGRKKVCITFDGTQVKIYLNGNLLNTYTPATNPITGAFYGIFDSHGGIYDQQKEVYKTFLTPKAITQAEAEKLTTL